eukprot:TRINITY_DN7352_c1_g1_i1.p1 TRINITY_DN7352_c1_g1~~TRINITY_DN7352_c1_g1_i1.p1  ORF type:complete len:1456 (+),score=435.28 TRINITY_DN7352_c1_g1_i1:86-4453(+)
MALTVAQRSDAVATAGVGASLAGGRRVGELRAELQELRRLRLAAPTQPLRCCSPQPGAFLAPEHGGFAAPASSAIAGALVAQNQQLRAEQRGVAHEAAVRGIVDGAVREAHARDVAVLMGQVDIATARAERCEAALRSAQEQQRRFQQGSPQEAARARSPLRLGAPDRSAAEPIRRASEASALDSPPPSARTDSVGPASLQVHVTDSPPPATPPSPSAAGPSRRQSGFHSCPRSSPRGSERGERRAHFDFGSGALAVQDLRLQGDGAAAAPLQDPEAAQLPPGACLAVAPPLPQPRGGAGGVAGPPRERCGLRGEGAADAAASRLPEAAAAAGALLQTTEEGRRRRVFIWWRTLAVASGAAGRKGLAAVRWRAAAVSQLECRTAAGLRRAAWKRLRRHWLIRRGAAQQRVQRHARSRRNQAAALLLGAAQERAMGRAFAVLGWHAAAAGRKRADAYSQQLRSALIAQTGLCDSRRAALARLQRPLCDQLAACIPAALRARSFHRWAALAAPDAARRQRREAQSYAAGRAAAEAALERERAQLRAQLRDAAAVESRALLDSARLESQLREQLAASEARLAEARESAQRVVVQAGADIQAVAEKADAERAAARAAQAAAGELREQLDSTARRVAALEQELRRAREAQAEAEAAARLAADQAAESLQRKAQLRQLQQRDHQLLQALDVLLGQSERGLQRRAYRRLEARADRAAARREVAAAAARQQAAASATRRSHSAVLCGALLSQTNHARLLRTFTAWWRRALRLRRKRMRRQLRVLATKRGCDDRMRGAWQCFRVLHAAAQSRRLSEARRELDRVVADLRGSAREQEAQWGGGVSGEQLDDLKAGIAELRADCAAQGAEALRLHECLQRAEEQAEGLRLSAEENAGLRRAAEERERILAASPGQADLAVLRQTLDHLKAAARPSAAAAPEVLAALRRCFAAAVAAGAMDPRSGTVGRGALQEALQRDPEAEELFIGMSGRGGARYPLAALFAAPSGTQGVTWSELRAAVFAPPPRSADSDAQTILALRGLLADALCAAAQLREDNEKLRSEGELGGGCAPPAVDALQQARAAADHAADSLLRAAAADPAPAQPQERRLLAELQERCDAASAENLSLRREVAELRQRSAHPRDVHALRDGLRASELRCAQLRRELLQVVGDNARLERSTEALRLAVRRAAEAEQLRRAADSRTLSVTSRGHQAVASRLADAYGAAGDVIVLRVSGDDAAFLAGGRLLVHPRLTARLVGAEGAAAARVVASAALPTRPQGGAALRIRQAVCADASAILVSLCDLGETLAEAALALPLAQGGCDVRMAPPGRADPGCVEAVLTLHCSTEAAHSGAAAARLASRLSVLSPRHVTAVRDAATDCATEPAPACSSPLSTDGRQVRWTGAESPPPCPCSPTPRRPPRQAAAATPQGDPAQPAAASVPRPLAAAAGAPGEGAPDALGPDCPVQ